MSNPTQETTTGTSLPQLQWGGAKVRLECAFLGKTHRIELDSPFARIGSDPRCEFCIPGLPAPVCVYLQICKSYVAVIELVESNPASVCEPVFAMTGGTVWIQPNARITIESIEPSVSQQGEPEGFSWENFNVEDVRVFPNTLVARSGFFIQEKSAPQLRLLSGLSVLGTASSCHLRANHKHISKYQAIVFRGEHQGEPCRVVDLFGQYPTTVENAVANGQVMEIGGKLRISNLVFEAVRFLYNASRPSQIVEVRTQFTSLPLPKQSKETSSEPRPPSAPSVIHAVTERLTRAIGFDSGNTTKARMHIPLDDRKEDSPKEIHSRASQTVPDGIHGLERVAVSQERLAAEFEKLSSRLEGVEKSLISIPEMLQQNSLHILETMDSLREIVERNLAKTTLSGSPEETPLAASSSPKQTTNLHTKPLTKPQPKRDLKAQTTPANSETQPKTTNKPSPPPASRDQRGNPKRPDSKLPSSTSGTEEVREKSDSWMDRTISKLTGWLPKSHRPSREVLQQQDAKDPLNLGSQSTATRKRLQQHEDESELLAASQSEDESLVLGSLMGFRYRDSKKSFFRWLLFGMVLIATTCLTTPLVWQNIPEGWRELIWQKITFAEPEKEREYQPRPLETSPKVPSLEPEKSTDPEASDPPSQ